MARRGAAAAQGATVLSTESVRLSELEPYPGNPRVGDLDMIRQSIRDHGQYRAMVANRRTGQVLAGNHLLHAMKAEGWTEGLVHWVDVDETEAAKIVLVDNRTADLGRYDDALLAQLLQSLPDLDSTGYTSEYLDDLVQKLATADLGAMREKYGDADERLLWPTVTFRIPPELKARFERLVEGITSDVEQFEFLVSRAEEMQ